VNPAGQWLRNLAAVAVRPGLWATAVAQGRRLSCDGWWRERPYLPHPAHSYMRFRLETAYGDPGHDVESGDLIAYLKWCRWMRALNS
jgi:hypothetical protein